MRIEDGFQQVRHCIIMTDSQGIIQEANQMAREILGFEGDKLKESGQKILDESKLSQVLVSGEAVWDDKVRVGERTLLFQHKPVSQEGRMVGAVSSFLDITPYEEQAGEIEELRRLNSELEEVFDASFDEIYVTDGEGNALRINKAGQQLFGMKAEEIIGVNTLELEKRGLMVPSITPQVIKEKRRITGLQTAGNGKKLITTANPVFDQDGKIIRIVTNSRDITELTNLRQRLTETEKLVDNYRVELLKLRKGHLHKNEIVQVSQAMQGIMKLVEKVAGVDSTVFIQGELGTGKGLVASRIHELSKRSQKPFISVNCRAYSRELIETKLFGYEEQELSGTGIRVKEGLIRLADGGTLFFEEITDFPLELQKKLLDVIQKQTFKRVGGKAMLEVDVRIIAATSQNIQHLVRTKQFREDLYYFLNVIPMMIPPLRHRKEDIPTLIEKFLQVLGEQYQLHKTVSAEALKALMAYGWPGNAGELQNVVERLAVTVDAYEILTSHLPDYILHAEGSSEKVMVMDICSLKSATEEVEKQLLKKALTLFDSTYQMAEALHVDQSTIVRKMRRYGIMKEKGSINPN